MFGTLKPHTCALVQDQRNEYNTFYCGLCKSLGDGYGTLSRALVSHDSVFLAVVADGLLDEAAQPDRCRCPLLPVVHRPTVRPDSVAMRYASAIQMLLGDQWLADRALEGKTLAQWGRPLAQVHVRSARSVLQDLGISLAPLEDFDVRQAHCEIIGETKPHEAALPTMEALGYVFSHITVLPGAGADLADPLVRADLEALGRAIGGVIYWADALDDLKKDYLAGDFNPCLVRSRIGKDVVISSARVERCAVLLDDALASIAQIVERLPWKRHREIVLNVLCHQLPRMTNAAIATARTVATEEEYLRLAAYRALPWYARFVRQTILVGMVLWAWLGGLRATLAQDKTKRTTPVPVPSMVASAQTVPMPIGSAVKDDAGAPDKPSSPSSADSTSSSPGSNGSAAAKTGPAPKSSAGRSRSESPKTGTISTSGSPPSSGKAKCKACLSCDPKTCVGLCCDGCDYCNCDKCCWNCPDYCEKYHCCNCCNGKCCC